MTAVTLATLRTRWQALTLASCAAERAHMVIKPGQRFGTLTALRQMPKRRMGKQFETCWEVSCDCGKLYVVRPWNLKNQRSCGCLLVSKIGFAVRERLRNHKTRAKRLGRVWEITDEEAIALFLAPCGYCGKLGTEAAPGGIDRIDSAVGYTKLNSQSCCGRCNKMKLAMTHDEFIAHVRRILQCQLSRSLL